MLVHFPCAFAFSNGNFSEHSLTWQWSIRGRSLGLTSVSIILSLNQQDVPVFVYLLFHKKREKNHLLSKRKQGNEFLSTGFCFQWCVHNSNNNHAEIGPLIPLLVVLSIGCKHCHHAPFSYIPWVHVCVIVQLDCFQKQIQPAASMLAVSGSPSIIKLNPTSLSYLLSHCVFHHIAITC